MAAHTVELRIEPLAFGNGIGIFFIRAGGLWRGDGWTGLELADAYASGGGPGWRFPEPPFLTLTGC
jgi:hypothetical protein